MSRSRKKHSVHKDPSNSQGKRLASRRYRRSVKQSIYHEKEIMPLEKEVTDTWSVVDFVIRGNKKKDPEYYEQLKRKGKT